MKGRGIRRGIAVTRGGAGNKLARDDVWEEGCWVKGVL